MGSLKGCGVNNDGTMPPQEKFTERDIINSPARRVKSKADCPFSE